VTVLDTAGIRESDDPVEQEGVRRARERAGQADLILWVEDAATASVLADPAIRATPTWLIRNKIDLISKEQNETIRTESIVSNIEFHLSATIGEGFEPLLAGLACHAADFFGAEPALVSRARHRKALETAHQALTRATAEGERGREDIIAEELRLAAQTLGRLTGRVDVEDILDVIFRDFCIGK
jgi:tRNA modification GTPase